MRTLPVNEVELFFHLFWHLLAYTNRQFDIVPGLRSLADFQSGALADDVALIQNKLYSAPEIIKNYTTGNPDKLAPADISVIRSWAHFVHGSFYLVRFLKNYTVFLSSGDQPLAYAVQGLYDDLADKLALENRSLPILFNTTLLPWPSGIIYDGILELKPLVFGPGISWDINRTYQETKTQFGLITTLPYQPLKPSDEQLLRSYLRNEASRYEHHEEIWSLVKKNPALRILYWQETGKAAARRLGREIRKRGLNPGWFAIYQEMIIASGENKQVVKTAAQKMVPAYDIDTVHYFQLKEKHAQKAN